MTMSNDPGVVFEPIIMEVNPGDFHTHIDLMVDGEKRGFSYRFGGKDHIWVDDDHRNLIPRIQAAFPEAVVF